MNTAEENIKELVNLKSDIYKHINELEKFIISEKKRINDIEVKLMAMCKHKWELENYYGVYEKPDKICNKCGSRIIRY